jgi:hypothetical protein
MCRALLSGFIAEGFFCCVSVWGQANACDLSNHGRVDRRDVQAAINMSLGFSPCNAAIFGTNVCNVVAVQRVINASLGADCITETGMSAHSACLTWTASASANVVAYKVYRGTVSGGPYTLLYTLHSPDGKITSATDNTVVSGMTYYYVVTAVDSNNRESSYSSQAEAVIPIP